MLSLLAALEAGCGAPGHAATGDTKPTTTRPTTTQPTTLSSPATTRSSSGREFPDFRIAMDDATDYLDPGLSDTTEGWGLMWNVYLPLLGYPHVNGKAGATLVPYLATSLPHISKDLRTYKLTLRRGLRYSNGTPVEASDFKKTVERDFVLDSAGAGLFRNIAGAKQFAKQRKGGIRGIVIDDARRTIVIHLRKPQGDFENVLASEFAAPVPPNAPRADTSLHPLPATGPYEIASYRPKSRIVEVRNPNFQAWRFHGVVPAGNPDRVTWDLVPTAAAALRRVLSGQDDWMSYYPIPSNRLAGIEQKHKGQLRIFTPPNLLYFFMNTRVPPFNSLEVRRAVNFAISRRWLKRLAGGLAHTTENILPPTFGFQAHRLYPHELRKAIRLVRKSGYRGKRVFVWNHDVAADLPFTEYLVSLLNRIGFRASEKVVTASDYWTTIGDPKTRAQIGFADWVQDYPHPLDWFGLLDGRAITPTHNSNYANFDVGWVNREIAALTRLRRPKLTPTIDSRWKALDRKVMNLAPWAPFINREETDLFSARVDLRCYVNSVVYEFDYATICVKKVEK
jgi:peptide/nickel transport system substrate-binding protein